MINVLTQSLIYPLAFVLHQGKSYRHHLSGYIDGNSLAESLIKNDLARPYDGGKRLGWCPAS